MANFSVQIKPLVLVKINQISWRNWAVIGLLGLATGLSWQLIAFYQTAFYPQTYINGVAVGDKTLSEVSQILVKNRPIPPTFSLILATQEDFIASTSTQLGAHYKYDQELTKIFHQSHDLTFWSKIKKLFNPDKSFYSTDIVINPDQKRILISLLANQSDLPGIIPSLKLATSGQINSIEVNPGKTGQKLIVPDTELAVQVALNQFSATLAQPNSWPEFLAQNQLQPKKITVIAPVEITQTPLTETQVALAKTAASSLVKKQLKLMLNNQTFYWNDQLLVSLLNPNQTGPEKIQIASLSAELAKINQVLPSQPINAEFNYDPATLIAKNFNPGKAGLKLKIDLATTAISSALTSWLDKTNDQLTAEVPLVADSEEPAINLASTNDLGISELIGFGESYYAHSIPSRVHNVALTAKKINLTIIKPGAEFSFNKTLGEVSGATGFKPAYVIKSGRTELGDGGGVCQVSSTLFRSTLDAGLNITKRLPHSYRVTYYELNSDPGFDATVYAGEVDFRFINDTPGHLLIYTETDSQKLWMKVEIYGTKDGRVATISDYKKWGAAPPPPTEYIPDASLPTGKKKQIDWSASGLKASFVYTVRTVSGAIKQQETYTSVYRPWSAKYLVGI